MSPQDRSSCSFLLVESDPTAMLRLKRSLEELDYKSVSETSDFKSALRRLEERNFTHLIFCTEVLDIKPMDFLREAQRLEPNCVPIASSIYPDGDEIFEYLRGGAKGFIVRPFAMADLDDVIGLATKGEPLSDNVLQSQERNRSLAYMVMSKLDQACVVIKEYNCGRGDAAEVEEAKESFRSSAKIARLFAAGGPLKLLQDLQEVLIERALAPATRLGRLRRRLQKRRDSKSGEREVAR